MNPTTLPATQSTPALVPAQLTPDINPACVYLASLAPGSRASIRSALDCIAAILTDDRLDAEALPWHRLDYQHTAAIRAALAERYSLATANQRLSALRGVLQHAWQLHLMDADQYQRAVAVKSVRGSTLPAGRALTLDELVRLFGVCRSDESPAGARDAALLALLYGVGLRRSEAVGLDLGDYRPEPGELVVRGKGRKERMMPVTASVGACLARWLDVRGTEDGPLLHPVSKSGGIQPRRMSAQAVPGVLDKRAKQAGITSLSPHDLRRSFGTNLLAGGADLLATMRLMGHSQPTTTSRYDRRGDDQARAAIARLTVPA